MKTLKIIFFWGLFWGLLANLGFSYGVLGNEVFESIEDDDEGALYQLLKIEKQNPNENFGEEKNTPLHYAAYLGKTWALHMLLSFGANPNTQNKDGYTPLHFVAQKGVSEMVPLLLEKGANPCLLNKDGFMPIHLAASLGKLEIVQLLYKNCSHKVDIGGIDNVTPLDLASQNGHNEVVAFLLGKGANPNAMAKNSRGDSLHFAVHGGKPDTIELLLSYGVKINQTNDTGDTPFTWNGYIGNVQTAQILIKAGADPYLVTARFGYNALHTASIRGKEELLAYLLDQKIYKGDEKTTIGAIALHYASLYGHLGAMKILLKTGSDVNAKDKEGNTPLHYAISNNQEKAACFLLKEGGNPNNPNNKKETPLNWATKMGDISLIDALKKNSCV